MKASAIAHPNIALIKYWGKRNLKKNLPAVSSLSLTLSDFYTQTTVEWGSSEDSFVLNDMPQAARSAQRVFDFLDLIDPHRPPCAVLSKNNFPTAAGLASSSSAFAALALAATTAAQRDYTPKQLSVLARQGSGSACRSIWGGWVLWDRGSKESGEDSHGQPLADPDHWSLCMIIAVVSDQKKAISSTSGMLQSAQTSPFYSAWVESSQADIEAAKKAVLNKDLHTLGTLMEHSTLKMHATMMTTQPSIRYWKPKSLAIIECVEALRSRGFSCYQTMDAGPNVKILCPSQEAPHIAQEISRITTCHILAPGPHAHLC